MPACAKCNKTITRDSILCEECNKIYHPSCAKSYIKLRSARACCFHSISNPSDKGSTSPQRQKLSVADTSSTKDSSTPLFTFGSLSSTATLEPTTTMGTPTSNASQQLGVSLAAANNSVALQPQLNVNGQAELVNFRTLTPDDKLNALFEKVLVSQQQLDSLMLKVENHEARLTNLEMDSTSTKTEQMAIRKSVEKLHEKNDTLSTQITQLSNHNDSTDLVISGITSSTLIDTTYLCSLILAILQTVKPDTISRDIISCRYLSKKPSNQTQPGSSNSTKVTRSPSIIVNVLSKPLAIEFLRRKIKFGKLHTSQILQNLPADFDQSLLLPGHININEFLPKNLFELHRTVRQKTRLLGSGFITFVRNGQIYIKKKKEDKATAISSMADLDVFLEM